MTSDARRFMQDVVAGSAGGAAQIVIGHPFDTLKVKLQSMPRASAGAAVAEVSTLGVLRQTLAVEGVAGLFRGIAPPLATVSVLNAVLFSANGFLQNVARGVTKTPEGGQLSIPAYAACGAGGGVFVALVACPTELIKCRLQVTGAPFSGPAECATEIIRRRGLLGLFKGMEPTLLREMPGGATYFSTYQTVKRFLTPQGEKPTSTTLLLAGGLAGVCFWTLVYPMDMIKTRIQTDSDVKPVYRNSFDCGRQIVREGGFKALYRGAAPGIGRAFPANAVCFIVYEWVMERMAT